MKKKFLLLTLFMCLLGLYPININAQTTVTIGDDSLTTRRAPLDANEDYSISQMYYLEDEIKVNRNNMYGDITAISFKTLNEDGGQYPYKRTIKVYIKDVKDSNAGGTEMKKFESSDEFVSKEITFDKIGDWVEIKLDRPFTHKEGFNILVCVCDKYSGKFASPAPHFYSFLESSEHRTIYASNHMNTEYDPTNTKYSGNYTNTPCIQFTFESGPEVTLKSPANGKTDVFNESLEYTLSGITEYQLYIDKNEATGTDVTNPITSITEDDWILSTSSSDSRHILDLGLEYGTQYVWKVVGRTEDGVKIPSDVFTFTTRNVTSAPGAPTLDAPTSDYITEANENPALSWTFGDNTEEYQVYLGTDNNSDSNIEWECVKDWTRTTKGQKTASYQTSDSGANTYYWKVVCRNGIGETSSDVFSFTKIGAPDNVTPIYPTDGATGVSTDATLTWEFAPNTTEYRVMWYDLQWSGYYNVTDWLPVQSTEGSYKPSGLNANTTYKWAIEVKNDDGQRTMFEGGDPVSTFSFTTSDIQAVSYTSPINNTIISTETATLSWNYGSQNTATHYQVLLGTDPDNMSVVKDWTERAMIGTGYETSDSFITEALSSNSKYYWQVNIKNDQITAPGEVVSFISKLDNPVVAENVIYLYPGSNIEASANVAWNAIENIAGYKVYSNGILVSNGVINTTNMQASGLTFNNGNANEVKIVAVYEFDGEQYESSGTIIKVYVSGYIEVSGTISNAHNNNKVSGATVKYTGSSAFEDNDEQTITFTTNNNGFFSGYIPAGTFVMSVTADNYKDYVGEEAKSYNYTTEYIAEDAKLTPDVPDDVTPIDPTDGATDVSTDATLTWEFAPNTTHYRVLMGKTANVGYEVGNATQWIAVDGQTASFDISEYGTISTNTTYYWAIDVMNDNGQRTIHQGGEKAMVFSFTTTSIDAATLEEPANNATITVPTTTLKWKYVGDAAEYQVCYGTDQNNLTAQGWTDRSEIVGGTGGYKEEDTFTIDNLAPATTYYWKVQVRKDGVEPIDSEVWSFTTIGLPEAVTNMQPDDEASLSANPNLSWAFGANTNEYQVLLGTTNPPTDVVVDWTSTLATTYQTSVDANIEYYWQVNVRNAFGETTGSVYSFTKAGVPDDVTPIDPVDGATGVSTIVTLTWRFAPNTTRYRVLVDIGNGGFEYLPNSNWIEVTGETASFSTDGLGLEANKTYYWAVDVENNIGTRTIYGDGIKAASYSFTTTDKTEAKYTAPLNDEIMKTTTATLQWKYGAGNIVDYYKVYFGKDENNLVAVTEWQERGMTSSDTYTTEVLDNDTRYYWRVDVKYGEDGDVLEGETATFVSLLTVPKNLSCITNVYPDTPFDISWDATAKATGYNIYVDGIMLSENISGTTYSHTMTNSDYNMAKGHDIQVTAVYAGLGESQKGDTVNVKVTGYGGIRGLVQNINGENIANATIILVGADEFGNEKTITGITTNNVGYFESNEVLVGTYTLKVNANNIYDEFVDDREISIEYGKTLNFSTIVLKSQYIYTVTLGNVKASSVMILLSDGSQINIGDDFDVILEYEGNIVSTTVVNISSYSVYAMGLEYDGIWNQPSGTYRFGIRRTGAPEDAICWSDNYNRNFHVFINDGDWNEASNWNNGVVPPANSDMWILKNATIKAGDVVNVGKLHIEYTVLESLGRTFEGSLEINGSLIASMINNEKYDNLILNDGGQFRQTGLGSAINYDLNGVFNMNIDNPTEWQPHNKTGWQFISSPFQNASIAKFVNESGSGDHDLYRYDGTRTKEEWLNEKDKNGITEEEFILGRAYLASYETADSVELTGTFYQLRTFDYTQKYSFTYNPDGNLENFHLLGNPFTFDIDWANFSRRGIVDAYAVVNSKGEYEYYNSGTIKVGDGFFIKTTSSTVQFEYNDNYTATRSREQGNSINIKLHSNAGNDNVIVGFDGREEGFPKLENFNDESATICVLDNDKRYAVVNYDEDVKEVELAFEASRMGLYTIEIEADGNFDNIILLDRFTGEETDMLNGNYKFTASNQEDYNRFLIKLAKGQEPADEAKFVYQSGNELILNVKGNVQIVDVMGRIVYNEEVVNDVNRIDISALRNSTYVVRVTNEEGTKVTKVVVY